MVRAEPRRPEIAIAVLIAGAVTHALLCVPAIQCRGYPPIAPIWYGVTFIWPVAVLISAYFDSTQFSVRRKQLIVYSLATAFFTAGTVVGVVPRRMGQVEMLLGTIFFGPLHLIVAFTVESASQNIYAFGRQLVEIRNDVSRTSFSVFSFFALIAWICLILGIPLGYQSTIMKRVYSDAIEQADSNWKTNALVFGELRYEQLDDVTVIHNFDSDTGLELKTQRPDLGFRDRYNARVRELIELHGLPAYSIKHIMPKQDHLIQLLDATDLDRVDSFPFDLSENIQLERRGPPVGANGASTSSSGSLSIITPALQMGLGDGISQVHHKKTDDVIYIREGTNWVGAFLHDGRMIMSASRSHSVNP